MMSALRSAPTRNLDHTTLIKLVRNSFHSLRFVGKGGLQKVESENFMRLQI